MADSMVKYRSARYVSVIDDPARFEDTYKLLGSFRPFSPRRIGRTGAPFLRFRLGQVDLPHARPG
jgi:hypothetical protein